MPQVQVMFMLQNTPLQSFQLPGLLVTPLQLELGRNEVVLTMYDLIIQIEESTEGLALLVQYSNDLFDEKTISQMLKHYADILEGIPGHLDRGITSLLRKEAER
jgi:non-ribosomal peptide synthetase component F